MFIAGIDTTYKTIEWTMAELLKNPREMVKVQAEVRQVAAGTHGGVLEEELEKMSFLHAAIKEWKKSKTNLKFVGLAKSNPQVRIPEIVTLNL